MKLARLDSMPTSLISFDVETYRIQAGLIAPPLVLASAAWLEGDKIRGELLDKRAATELFCMLLDDPTKVVGGANVPYDLLVMALRLVSLGIDPMPAIFKALMDDGRVFDIQTAQMLDAIAEGCLGKDPRTGGPIVSPDTGRRGGYSLSVVTDLVLGRTNAKALGHVATEYGLYDNVPLNLLPEDMRQYPVDDACNTEEDALAQAGWWPRAGAHRWGANTECEWCGIHPKLAYVDGQYVPCKARRRARNLHDLANQVGTAFAMHMAAGWGFRVNQNSVDIIQEDALDGRVEAEEPFVQAGLLKRNRDGSTSRDMSAICRAVATAYGASGSCTTCSGTRKVVSSKAKPVKCPMCKAQGSIGYNVCPKCNGQTTIPDPKQLVNCTDCGATGLDLATSPHLPKTDTGRVGTGRDVLNESGDEMLMALADHQEDAKTLDVYVPYLRKARTPIAGHSEGCPAKLESSNDCICPGPYKDIPLTLWPNVLLETGRTSYRGVIQLFPRKGGHRSTKRLGSDGKGAWIPSLRECIEARPGHVFSSEDYESGELVTHAQSCLWICGDSQLATALIQGLKVHNLLGAGMIGMPYDEFQKIIGDSNHPRYQAAKDARQAAKPGNFGFPGGMGPVKMVLQQRKQGPDTPHPSGPTMVKDDNGVLVRGYKGLRFCILMAGADRCGTDMVTEWPPRNPSGRGREPQPIAPTCRKCIECALELKEAWLKQWPENVEYFKYINDCCENGQLITTAHLELWPHLRDFFVPNRRLAPSEIMQHVSGRIRGGVDYCSAANGFFQGLLADLAKSALRRISRECYDRTVRVPDLAHANSKRSTYAGGSSPLYGHRPIVFAHDEIILEHPESEAHDGAMRVSEIMVEEMMWYCPDLAAACAAEPTLMHKWFKGATPVWKIGGKKRQGPDDRLTPWQPKH